MDIRSETWQEVEAFAKSMLDDAKEICIAATIDQRQADFQRGIAYMAKKLIDLGCGEVAPKTHVIPFD